MHLRVDSLHLTKAENTERSMETSGDRKWEPLKQRYDVLKEMSSTQNPGCLFGPLRGGEPPAKQVSHEFADSEHIFSESWERVEPHFCSSKPAF